MYMGRFFFYIVVLHIMLAHFYSYAMENVYELWLNVSDVPINNYILDSPWRIDNQESQVPQQTSQPNNTNQIRAQVTSNTTKRKSNVRKQDDNRKKEKEVSLQINDMDPEKIAESIQNGADPNAMYYKGEPVLFSVMDKNNAEYLIGLGVDLKVKGYLDRNLLHKVMKAREYSSELAEFYLAQSINPNSCDQEGATPLHYLTMTSAQYIDHLDELKLKLELLLGADASVSTKNQKGKTPLDVAKGEVRFWTKLKVKDEQCKATYASPTKYLVARLEEYQSQTNNRN